MNTRSFFSYNISDVAAILEGLGQPRFRTQQLLKWAYVDGVSSYDEMTNLPRTLRQQLAEQYPFIPLQISDHQVAEDGTRKYVFTLDDGAAVEAVGIPSFDRKSTKDEPRHLTVCFSTQAGCAMECAFCATGHEGLTRSLSSGEMIAQIQAVQNDFGVRVTNLVSMGQGEPFQNYDAVLDALRFANAKNGLGIGARHITVSTCGLFKGIDRLSQEPEQFTLAVSLHAARQDVRDRLMPHCSGQPLPELKKHLVGYVEATGRRVSLEYLMIDGVNDQDEDLVALKLFCQGLLCHINLIPINAIDDSTFKPSRPALQNQWVDELRSEGKECTIRNSRGSDIDGACGQLKNKRKKNDRF